MAKQTVTFLSDILDTFGIWRNTTKKKNFPFIFLSFPC